MSRFEWRALSRGVAQRGALLGISTWLICPDGGTYYSPKAAEWVIDITPESRAFLFGGAR